MSKVNTGVITDDVGKDNDQLSPDNGFHNIHSNHANNNVNVCVCVICDRLCREVDRVQDIISWGNALQ